MGGVVQCFMVVLLLLKLIYVFFQSIIAVRVAMRLIQHKRLNTEASLRDIFVPPVWYGVKLESRTEMVRYWSDWKYTMHTPKFHLVRGRWAKDLKRDRLHFCKRQKSRTRSTHETIVETIVNIHTWLNAHRRCLHVSLSLTWYKQTIFHSQTFVSHTIVCQFDSSVLLYDAVTIKFFPLPGRQIEYSSYVLIQYAMPRLASELVSRSPTWHVFKWLLS